MDLSNNIILNVFVKTFTTNLNNFITQNRIALQKQFLNYSISKSFRKVIYDFVSLNDIYYKTLLNKCFNNYYILKIIKKIYYNSTYYIIKTFNKENNTYINFKCKQDKDTDIPFTFKKLLHFFVNKYIEFNRDKQYILTINYASPIIPGVNYNRLIVI